jgi:outer membrane protein assembly factor BamD
MFFLSGCSCFQKKDEKSAQELSLEGMEEYQKGNYSLAIQSFEKLKDWYPFSKFAILAELKIADAHYRLNHYDEAILAYEEFEGLHPKNESIPYVIYQIGRCYFDQIDAVDRDQSSTKKALDTFKRLQRQFPNHSYSKRADAHIHKCLQSLAGHEFYVGHFYFKTKRYKAALKRFEKILYDYPDVGIHQKAIEYIVRCETILNNKS